MDIMESVYRRAKARPMRVAFPEAEEEKIIQAARQCADEGICAPVLVGHANGIRAAAEGFGFMLMFSIILTFVTKIPVRRRKRRR